MMKVEELAVEHAMCPECEARPTERCKTANGRFATVPHAARRAAVMAGYDVGYAEGEADLYGNLTRNIDRAFMADADRRLGHDDVLSIRRMVNRSRVSPE